MEKAVLIVIFTVLVISVNAQKAFTFRKAIESGISIEKLDSVYKPALSQGADSLQAVFRHNPTEFHAHYIDLLKSLSKHLKDQGFKWMKQTRCFNRIYFNERGTIDFFLYNFWEGKIDADKAIQFEKLLTSFIETYTFTLTAPARFAQCSPVTYND